MYVEKREKLKRYQMSRGEAGRKKNFRPQSALVAFENPISPGQRKRFAGPLNTSTLDPINDIR